MIITLELEFVKMYTNNKIIHTNTGFCKTRIACYDILFDEKQYKFLTDDKWTSDNIRDTLMYMICTNDMNEMTVQIQ